MVKTTRKQRIALYRKWRHMSGMTYKQFRKTVHHTIGCDGAVAVIWCGMWLCIERDGYTHS